MLTELFELASNSALEHGPKTKERLAKLEGKAMALHIKSINQSLAIMPTPTGIEYSRDMPEQVDVTLSATLSAMIKISRNGMEDADLQPGELEITGDPIVAQRFARIISDLDINWDTLLAEHLGESPARAVMIAAEQAKHFSETAKTQAQDYINTLINDELEVTVKQTEVDTFLDSVDTLRADADRLAARIQRIQNSVPNSV